MPEKPATSNDNEKSPWLETAMKMVEDLKLEPKEVQDSIRQMSRKTYPETWKAIRDKECDS